MFHQNQTGTEEWSPIGPYVDKAVFHVITGQDIQIAALLAGDIDHLTETLEPNYFDIGPVDPAINVTYTPRLGFGHMSINCDRYPYSIPAFRRALAYAVDKEEVARIMWGGLGFGSDNPILEACGIWHNNDTDPSFVESNIPAAQAELLAAGFIDLNGDGFVEAPDGSSFQFQPMYPQELQLFGHALDSMKSYWDQAGIPSEPIPVAFGILLDTVYTIPRNYDAACFTDNIKPNPLMLRYWITDEITNPEGNHLNWANATYDAYVELMMTASDFGTVLDAAHRAQQIFVENAPMLVLYSNWEVHAYRTDRFEGWIVAPGYGLGGMNQWTPRKVKLLPDQPERDAFSGTGGTFHTMIAAPMDSQNPLTATSVYGRYPLSQIYISLTGLPNPRDHSTTFHGGGVAFYWEMTELTDSLQLDFTLYGDDVDHPPAYWHDGGGQVRAQDVKFTYDYIINHSIPNFSHQIPYVNRTEVLDEYHVRIVTNGKSYWTFEAIGDWPILPQHLWSGVTSPVTYGNPVPVGCGPFKWNRRVAGEYLDLDFWELYHEGVPMTPGPPPPPDTRPFILGAAVTIIAGTLVACLIYLYHPSFRPSEKRPRPPPEPGTLPPTSITEPRSCPYCGTQLFGDERFCPGCGEHQ